MEIFNLLSDIGLDADFEKLGEESGQFELPMKSEKSLTTYKPFLSNVNAKYAKKLAVKREKREKQMQYGIDLKKRFNRFNIYEPSMTGSKKDLDSVSLSDLSMLRKYHRVDMNQ